MNDSVDTNESPFDENADDAAIEVIDELTSLKNRADTMKLRYHPNIGVDKLRDKISASIKGEPDPDEVFPEVETQDPIVILPLLTKQKL